MYNTYIIELLAERDPIKALDLARIEVDNRATPETYQLLAFANLKAGNPELALSIIEAKVVGKTYEPMAAYHCALIYKANGMHKKVRVIKEELSHAEFELGLLLTSKIEAL
jgi:hypothetical protein